MIIEKDGKKYEVIEIIEDDTEDARITFFKRWSDEKACLEAVKQNGDALQYVKAQSEKICLEAVKQDGDALQYVKAQEHFEEITGFKLLKVQEEKEK